ncbi:hypothetical protein KSS87_010790 [Heliosperma pusillum]|nr:hypothetical protein KSS87_010790 [Heliosperma pusillum]
MIHPANILLTISNLILDFTAKLSDFGLAKMGPEGSNTHVTTRVMGTYGYAAPEYVSTGHLTTKSDVYSFRVVLLEVFTGRRSIEKTRPKGEQHLVDWTRPYLSRSRRLRYILEPRLATMCELEPEGQAKDADVCTNT